MEFYQSNYLNKQISKCGKTLKDPSRLIDMLGSQVQIALSSYSVLKVALKLYADY